MGQLFHGYSYKNSDKAHSNENNSCGALLLAIQLAPSNDKHMQH